MKKKYLLILVILIGLSVNASAQLNYLFSATSRPYIPVTGGTTPHLVSDYVNWEVEDEGFARVPIGFTFNYDGENYTHANIDVNGFITLKDSLNIWYNYPYFRNSLASAPPYYKRPVIAPFWDDLLLLDTLNLVYKTTGHAPFRIFTVEWKKAKWVYESLAPVLSIELKLYETTNIIEFHYRDEGSLPDARYAFASIGISSADAHRDFISLQSASSHPDISMLKSMDSLTVKPANNQVYQFIPAFVKIPKSLRSSLQYTNDRVSFKLNPGHYNYEYALTKSAIPPSSGIKTFSPDIAISSLPPATTYYIYARTNWFGWFHSQWACDSFTTAVNPVVQPYHVSGDVSTGIPVPSSGGMIPFEMRQQNFSDTNYSFYSGYNAWQVITDFPHAGDTSLWDLNFDQYNADEWMFTPGIKLHAGKKYQVKFGYLSFYLYNVGDPASIEVKYGKATGAAAMRKTLFAKSDIRTFEDYDEYGSLPLTDTVIEISPDKTDMYYFGFHNLSSLTDGIPIIGNFSVSEKVCSAEKPYVLEGKSNHTGNVLQWSANEQQGNTTFEVQRSVDGINFTRIDEVPVQKKSSKNHPAIAIQRNSAISAVKNIRDKHSKLFDEMKPGIELQRGDIGKTAVKFNYEYVDNNAKSTNYYRLQKLNKNGKVVYSNIVALNNNGGFRAYPNPAKDLLNVAMPAVTNKEMTFLVTDVSGKPVLSKTIKSIKGQSIFPLDVSRLSSGVYFLKIMCSGDCEKGIIQFEKK